MSSNTILQALDLCVKSGYHLTEREGAVIAVQGTPVARDYSIGICALTRLLSQNITTPLDPIEAQNIMTKLCEFEAMPRHDGLLRHFMMRSVIQRETEAFARCRDVVFDHITNAYRHQLSVISKSLQTLIEQDNPAGFAMCFAPVYNPPKISGVNAVNVNAKYHETSHSLNQLMQDFRTQFSECSWLQKSDDWLSSIAPHPKGIKKELDLTGLDEKTMANILQAHVRYTHLRIILNCSQELFLRVCPLLKNAFFLDLTACTQMDWKVIQDVMTQLDVLQGLSLPIDLLNSDAPLSLRWKKELRKIIEDAVNDVRYSDGVARANHSAFMQGKREETAIAYNLAQGQFLWLLGERSWKRLALSYSFQLSEHDLIECKPQKIWLEYCPSITSNVTRALLQPEVSVFSLRGCLQVTDAFFPDEHPLLDPSNEFECEINLIGTSVTQVLVERLQKAQPKCTFIFDEHFLTVLPKYRPSTRDRRGLSEEAFDAVYHLTKTGYMPLVSSVALALELARHPLDFFQNAYTHAHFKKYIRALLLSNITPDSVIEIYAYARDHQDYALMQTCRTGVNLLCGAERDQNWEQRDPLYKGQIHSINEDSFPETNEDLDWMGSCASQKFERGEATFRTESESLLYLVEHKQYRYIAQRLQRACLNDTTAEALMAVMKERFPEEKWLDEFQSKLDLIANPPDLFDCRGISWPVYDAILFVAQKPVKVLLDCTDQELVRLDLKNVAFLDLRPSTGKKMVLQTIEPVLAKLPHLQNVYFPDDLQGLHTYYTLSKNWSESMDLLVKLHLVRLLKDAVTYTLEWFPRYNPCINIASVMRCVSLDGWHWKEAPRFMWSWILTVKEHLARATLPKKMDLSGLEIVTGEMIASLNFERGALKLDLAHCSGMTPEGLKELFTKKQIAYLSLFGCTQVNDSWFADATYIPACTLDLRATSVTELTQSMLAIRGIKVLYDPKCAVPEEEATDLHGLSAEAYKAVKKYLHTGYLPMLSVPVAIELLSKDFSAILPKERMILLKIFARRHIMNNVNLSNWHTLCNFRVNDDGLQWHVRTFVELFGHLLADKQELVDEMIHRRFPEHEYPSKFNFYEVAATDGDVTDLESRIKKLAVRKEHLLLSTRLPAHSEL